jgi:hypothetical protein
LDSFIEQFKLKLESVKPMPTRSRLRPTYSVEWIKELKGKLSKLSTQNGSGNSSKDEGEYPPQNNSGVYSEIVSAVPCAGF